MSLLSPALNAFVAVAKIKTVHGAASELFLTQTAVTQRIKNLEASLKTTLFIRSRKGMILTTEGEALLRYCQAAKGLEGEALAQIQGVGIETEVELNITAPTSMMKSRVLSACTDVMKSYPNLLMHFQVEDIETRHHALKSGAADFAIVLEDHLAKEMKSKALKSEDYVLVCSSKWSKLSLKEIIKSKRIIDYDETDQMTFNYLRKLKQFDNANHGRVFVNRTDNLASLVCDEVGYTALPLEIANEYVSSGQMHLLTEKQPMLIKQFLVWYDRPEPPKYFSAIIESIN